MTRIRSIICHQFAVLSLLVAVAGCGIGAAGIPGVAEVESVTVIATDKTITDHIISLTSGKNCSSVRKEKGLHYCEEDEPFVEPSVFCYKTLARVTCYDRSDPYKEGYRKIGNNDHNMVKRKTAMPALPEMRQ